MLRNTKESDETFYETFSKLLRNILFVRTLPAERIPASFRFALVGNRYTIGYRPVTFYVPSPGTALPLDNRPSQCEFGAGRGLPERG